MSALPHYPLYDDDRVPQDPPKPPRRPRWKRILGWTFGTLGLLLLLLVVAVVVLLHNARFHQYVLRTAQQKATAAIGTQVRLREYKLTWSGISPTLDLYNVVVDGAAPYPQPPLFQVDHVRVAVTITSLLKRTWYLNDMVADHPQVRLLVDKNGASNIPVMKKSSNNSSNTNLFDLGIRHAALNNGEVYYNDKKSLLDADLHELTFNASFNEAKKEYSGALSYRDGHLHSGDYNPIPHDLDAKFTATPDQFTLQDATLRSGHSRFVLNAQVSDYNDPTVHADYNAEVDAGEFRHILKNPSLPSGVLAAKGNLEYHALPGKQAIEAVKLSGTLNSRKLTVSSSSVRAAVTDLDAAYSLGNGDLAVRDVRARLFGGELSANANMRNLGGASSSDLAASLKNASLSQLVAASPSAGAQKVDITGSLNATANAKWGKTMADLVAKADAGIHGNIAPRNGAAGVPAEGVVHALYSAPAKTLTLNQSYLKTRATQLNLNGTVSDRSQLQVALHSGDLHELETAMELFRPTPAGQAPLALYGTADFSGTVRGSTADPHLSGQLVANNLGLKGTSWKLIKTGLDVSPAEASLQNADLRPASGGRITFNLTAGLNHWAFQASDPIAVRLSANQINVADLARVAGSSMLVSGKLGADLAVRGTGESPIGNGTVTLTNAKVSAETIQSMKVKFQGTAQEVHADAGLQMAAGGVNANLVYYPKQKTYDARVESDGIHLEQLQTVKDRNLKLQGVLQLAASGRGEISNPSLQATAQIAQLHIQDQVISGIRLTTSVANHAAEFAFDSDLINTHAQARGKVNLTGDYYADATVDTQPIPFAPLVAVYAPAQAGNITGQTEIHATIRGPLKDKTRLEAHVTIPQLAANYKNVVEMAAAAPIHADLVNGVLTLQRSAIRGTDTNLEFQGSIPIAGNGASSLLLQGTVDLQLAQLFNPDITSSGQLKLDVNSYGQRSNQDVQGHIQVVNATFAGAGLPVGLQNGNGTLALTKDRIQIEKFEGGVGGGTVTATGGATYRPALQFDLGVGARNVRLLYPDGVRTQIGGDIALNGNMENSLLHGNVRIQQLAFTPDFDLMDFAGQFGGTVSPPPAQGMTQNMQLDIALTSTSGINLVSRELSVAGAANLHVRGTAAEPVILGRVNLDGGDLIFHGSRYILQGGTIDFVNPSKTTPVMNVSVNTTVDQYNIQMHFWGPADHMHTNYSSDPALPPSDIINLIAFGKTTEASAADPTPPGNLGAESLIASQVSSQVTNRLQKAAGISQLSIDPVLGGNGQNPGARVAIQQRVTSKIFVTFATDVTSTQKQTIKLEYQVSPRVSVSAVRDQNGGIAVDTKIHKNW